MSLYCPDCGTSYDDEALRICPIDGARLFKMDKKAQDPLLGAVIDGRFRIDAVIGEGGMGTVYRGQQLSVTRDVAIKVLRADLSHKQVALERFFREAKTISNLSHPNIVRLIEFGQDRDLDLLYLVMELVPGFNLADLVAEGRMRTSVALNVLYQSCGALTEPHAAGVIHRDLKPDNILLVPMSDGTIQTKVLDFGIARALEQNTQITATGMICGTPAYMAPEQAQNEDLDSRADLYSLGVIFYEMLSGWPPFSGTSSLQIMLKHIQENPTPLRDLVPPGTLIPPIEALVDDLMQKERDDRPMTARGIRTRIDALRRDLGFEPVHVEPGMSLDEAIDAWLLPKLPRSSGTKSGPTEVFRRETGMEHWLTNVDDSGSLEVTNDQVAKTVPDSKDERVKVATRKGAQQAWTPEGQGAVQRIKDTNDAPSALKVDAFGATVDVGTPNDLQPAAPRRTVVEDGLGQDSSPSQSTGETRPVTQEDLHAPSDRSGRIKIKTETGQRAVENDPTMETLRPSSDRHLLFAAIALALVALGGAIAVLYFVTQAKSGANQPQVAVVEPEQPEAVVQTAEPAPATVGIVRALAREKVAGGVKAALLESRGQVAESKSKSSTKPKRPKSKAGGTAAKTAQTPEDTRPKPKEDVSYEKLFGNGRLRNE